MPSHLQILFLLFFSFFLFSKAITAQSINAMSFEDAEDIAIKSIRRASGIRVKQIKLASTLTYSQLSKRLKKAKYLRNCLNSDELENYHNKGNENSNEADDPVLNIIGLQTRMNEKCFPYKRMRLTDSLDFLGITDEFRLAALRGYIVKNVEFGVQNVWGVDVNERAQSYVISGKQLEDIKTSTTVIDLAKKIQSSAALPFLSYSTAETLVRNCRYKVIGAAAIAESLDKNIRDDINTAINKEAFIHCLDDGSFWTKDANNVSVQYKHGVQSVKIINNEGDAKFYYLTTGFKDGLSTTIDTDNYKSLVEKLVNSSGIPSSDKFIATQIVINSLREIVNEKINLKNNKIRESNQKNNTDIPEIPTIRRFTNFRVSNLLSQLKEYGTPPASGSGVSSGVSVENTLFSINVDAGELTEKIENETDSDKYFILIERKNARNKPEKILFKVSKISLTNLQNSMSIDRIIDEVSIHIKKQRGK